MDISAFRTALHTAGFEAPVTVSREAHGHLPEHSHPFEARALILAGEIHLRTADAPLTRRYAVGDIFHLAAHALHEETYGPEGVVYLVGRKAAAGKA